jgi:serine/threonine protein kinase
MVALHDFFWDDDNYYMVIDLCEGGDLFNYIVQHNAIDEPTASVIFRQVSTAIGYCHSFSVAHRDLKPENILICKFPQIKVTDFGLCGSMTPHKLMETFCGSPCYCSPECISHIQYDGRKSDIWSLGVVLFVMVMGQLPWTTYNAPLMIQQIRRGAYTFPSKVSPECRDLLSKMIVVNPSDRFTIEQVLSHPWMKMSWPSPGHRMAELLALSLPAPDAVSIEDIRNESSRTARRSERGIFSPFSDEEDGGGQVTGLPKLVPVRCQPVQRASSVGSRTRLVGSKLQMIQRRQMVALAGQGILPPLRRLPMPANEGEASANPP